MTPPRDYDEDDRYQEQRSPVLKWVAGLVGGVIVVLAGFAVSCTSAKMDRLLEKQDDLGGDVRDLRGDVKVVTTKLEAQEKIYERDRDQTDRRLNAIERRP
jgi:hypothetical protein